MVEEGGPGREARVRVRVGVRVRVRVRLWLVAEEGGAHEDARAVRITRGRGAEEAVPRALVRVRVRVS